MGMFRIVVCFLLCGSSVAFVSSPLPCRSRRERQLSCPTMSTKSELEADTVSNSLKSKTIVTLPASQRRRAMATAAALMAAAAWPSKSNALFGIGEQFQVFEEEDPGQEKPVYGSKDIMKKKKHGTSEKPVMKNLRFGCDYNLADKISNYNRHFAENAGYFSHTTWLKEVDPSAETAYYDSVTGKPLFIAPRGRTFEAFVKESKVHGWPSFRDEEVVWENVRCLRDGECVSLTGTHLGHNLPDRSGNRYCINLVSIAGSPDPVSTRSLD